MSPRRSTAVKLDPPVDPPDPAREHLRAALEAALLTEMKEQGITAEELFETLDVDSAEYLRWLETGEGPEPGTRR